MKNILWLSRHRPTPKQQTELHGLLLVELRLMRIRRYRNRFLVLTMALIGMAVASSLIGIHYEPFVATSIASTGIAVVMAMKSHGK